MGVTNMVVPHRQRGLGLLMLLVILANIALVSVIAIKIGPLYLNEMNVARAVHGVATDPELADAPPAVLRDRLQRRWDIDYIDQIQARDVKLKRTPKGRALVYKYEARVTLFYNIDIVVRFKNLYHLRGSGG